MAAPVKILRAETSEDWTVVLPRRGKKNRTFHMPVIPEQPKEVQQWKPLNLEVDPKRESQLMQRVQSCIEKLEKSEFWHSFVTQMQNHDMLDRFLKVLGSEDKMPIVIYGIGSIESYEDPRLQLSLAILMKRKFDWIGEIEVFDPIITLIEHKILTSLGCSVLSINEHGRRQALKPTMFFMPHCEIEMYGNLLETNWGVDQLNRLIILGNSFSVYQEQVSLPKISSVAGSRKYVWAVRSFTEEFGVSTLSDDSFQAFHSSSWHFFSHVTETELRRIQDDVFSSL